MPFISLQQVGGKLLLPPILQEVNASDQGCPVEAEARLPESPTEASTCPHFSQKGGRWETVHSLAFRGAMNPKAGERGRRAQRQCLHITPHPALDGVHRPWSCLLLSSRPSWGEWKAGFLLFMGEVRRQQNATRKRPAREHRVLEEGKGTHQLAEVCGSGKEVLYLSLASATLRKVQASSI